MIFSSFSFLICFLALLALYGTLTSAVQRATLLLIGSILFYASWEPLYLVLLLLSLFINHRIYCALVEKPSRLLLSWGIVVNLSVLAVFKYIGLVFSTASSIATWLDSSATLIKPDWMNWVLPLGISFFTFQMLGALIDAYRQDWREKITFRAWCLYVSFFPQLIAGPIVRPHQIFAQLQDLKPITKTNLQVGSIIFVAGLIKKTIFADNIGPIVDRLYASPEQLDFYLSWVATIAFGLQIYLDFSGYSEMALGIALMFGISLPRNFMYPYISRNFSEFWTRWHITLSQWLRDYLYIPLGGSRCSPTRTNMNLMLTMLLGGLWHGAGWTFVFWGFLHGSYLVIYHYWETYCRSVGLTKEAGAGWWMSMLGMPITFALTSLTWVFFRAPNFDDAWIISGAMLGGGGVVETSVQLRTYEQGIIFLTLFLVLLESRVVDFFKKVGVFWFWERVLPVFRGLFYATLILFVTIFGGDTQKFIYFDF